MKEFLNDEMVEVEIERLQRSPYVALARKEERIRNRRRQYMYALRGYEKKGRELDAAGVTMDELEQIGRQFDEKDPADMKVQASRKEKKHSISQKYMEGSE